MLPIETKADPRVKRTRHLLVNVLLELLCERDYQAITVQDIAARATLNRATFYVHFEGKPELLDYATRERFNEALVARLGADARLCETHLRLLILTVCEFLKMFGDHCTSPRHQFHEVVRTQVTAQVRDVLFTWLAEARPSAGRATNELAATAASWARYGAAFDWSQQARRSPPTQHVERMLPMLRSMLEAPIPA